MIEETTAARVIRVIAKGKKLPPDQLTVQTRFDELKMDSLDALNLIFALEEEFDLSIPNVDAIKMRSVGEAISGIERLRQAPAPGTA